MFIVSCPSSNMALPFTPYPTLTYTGQVATDETGSSGSGSYQLKARNYGGRNKSSWGKHWHDNSNSVAPPSAGAKVTFSVMDKNLPQGSYVTFVSGLMVVSVKGSVNGKSPSLYSSVPSLSAHNDCVTGKKISATIPSAAQGQTYVFVTSSSVTSLTDASVILYGPAILEVNPPAPSIDYSIQ